MPEQLRSLILAHLSDVRFTASRMQLGQRAATDRAQAQFSSWLQEHRATLETAEQLTWHSLAEQDLTAALRGIENGDAPTGCRHLHQAEHHFRRSFEPRKIDPKFLVGTDGRVRQA